MTARPQGHCRFCGKLEVSKEHIWNEWLQDLLPAAGDRVESWWVGNFEDFQTERAVYEEKSKHGAVHTKVARKYCKDCNGGWMRKIGEAAKPIVERLVTGKAIDLTASDQRVLASWIALSAMVADGQTRMPARFPDSDREYMFSHHAPPPHWYVLIGYYNGSAFGPVDFCYTFSGIDEPELNLLIVAHSLAATLGHLYGIVIVHSGVPASADRIPIVMHRPHLAPIWPTLAPLVRFSPNIPFRISGELRRDGGLARDLATRYAVHFAAAIKPAVDQFNESRRPAGPTAPPQN
jgi:hypothetical protein